MSVHDEGRFGYERQHTGFNHLVVSGYRAGCIMDWLESVAGWGVQAYHRPYMATNFGRVDAYVQRDWFREALDWQHSQPVSCRTAGCDGVKSV